jgi:hypothetical protein
LRRAGRPTECGGRKDGLKIHRPDAKFRGRQGRERRANQYPKGPAAQVNRREQPRPRLVQEPNSLVLDWNVLGDVVLMDLSGEMNNDLKADHNNVDFIVQMIRGTQGG